MSMQMHPERDSSIFVYGTLVGSAKLAFPARLHGVVKDTTGDYPTLLPAESGTVEGEVVPVTPMQLRRTDAYESEGFLYHRVPVAEDVFVYVGDTDKLGSNGDWTFDRGEIVEYFAQKVTLETEK